MANRITSDYDKQLKDDLFAEIELRKNEGSPNFADITTASLKDDLVAALVLDDEHKASKPSATPEAKSGGKAVVLPQVSANPIADVTCPPPPTDDQFTDGLAKKLSDGLQYAVCIHEPDTYNRTVTCKNSAYTWQGNAAQFREQFDKL